MDIVGENEHGPKLTLCWGICCVFAVRVRSSSASIISPNVFDKYLLKLRKQQTSLDAELRGEHVKAIFPTNDDANREYFNSAFNAEYSAFNAQPKFAAVSQPDETLCSTQHKTHSCTQFPPTTSCTDRVCFPSTRCRLDGLLRNCVTRSQVRVHSRKCSRHVQVCAKRMRRKTNTRDGSWVMSC